MSERTVDAATLETCEPLVRSIAARLRSQSRLRVDLDDLIQAGMVGLLEAESRFDPDAGVAFTTYAYPRIRGAMIDSLASLTGIRRSQARRLTRLRAANEFIESHEMASDVLGDADYVSQAVTGALFAADFAEVAEDVSAEEHDDADTSPLRVDAERSLGRAQLRTLVLATLDDLAEDEAAMLRAHYIDGRSLQSVAAELGYSRSWASRVHTRALENARGVLRRKYKLSALDIFFATNR